MCDFVLCIYFYLEIFFWFEYFFIIYGSEFFFIFVDINGVSVIKCVDRFEVSIVWIVNR